MINLASLPSAAATARLDWSVPVSGTTSRPVPTRDEVYLSTQTVDRRTEIHRYAADSGRKLSSAHTWPGVLESQVGSTAVLRSPDGQILGVNARTGERQWGFQPAEFTQALASDGETLVVAGDKSLTGITEVETSPMDISFVADLKDTKSIAPGQEGGWLVHTGRYTGEGRLNRLNAQGDPVWSVPVATGGPQHAPAVLPDGQVLTTNFDGYVAAHDGATGQERWRFETDETYTNRPDVGPDGQVVVSTCKGRVSQLDGQGQSAWSVDTGDRVQTTFIHQDGTVFVQHPGSLEALDGATGKSLQKLPIQSGDLVQGPDGSLFSLGRQGVLQRIVLEP